MADSDSSHGAGAWSASLAQSVIDALESHLAILDDRGVIVAVNQAWRRFAQDNQARLSGVGPGASYLAVCDAAAAEGVPEAQAAAAAIRDLLAGRQERFEIEYPCPSPDRSRWFILRIMPLRHPLAGPRLVVAHEDITARKWIELALRESEQRYRTWAQSSSDMICRHAPDGRFVYVSPACRTILGYEPEQLVGRSPYELFHPDDVERIRQSHERVLAGPVIDLIAYRMRCRDGQYRWVESTSQAVRDSDGAVVEIHTATRDMEARREQELALRRIQTAIEHVHDGVIITEPQLELPGPRIVYVNPAFCRMTGYRSEELIGRTPRILQGPKTDRATLDRLKRQLAAGRAFTGQTINYRKDGSEFLVEWQAAPVRDEQGQIIHYVSILRDITEKTRLLEQARQREAELAHVARLSTMGELASGLAHELNQPLSAVVNFTQGCLRHLRRGEWNRQALIDAMTQAAEEATRASRIIRQLRQFIHKRGPKVGPANLAELIDEAAGLLDYDLRREQVRLTIDCPPDLPAVWVDAIQIEQVLLNLMRNALEAMKPCDPSTRALIVTAAVNGREVVVTVRDRGLGLDPAVQARLFEPFFSTKPEGMGLGLSLSRSIVESHGGRLTAATADDGVGAAFTLTLPCRVAKPTRPPSPPTPPPTPPE